VLNRGDGEPLLVPAHGARPLHLRRPGVYEPEGRFVREHYLHPILLCPRLVLFSKSQPFLLHHRGEQGLLGSRTGRQVQPLLKCFLYERTCLLPQPATSFLSSLAVLNGCLRTWFLSLVSWTNVAILGRPDLGLFAGGEAVGGSSLRTAKCLRIVDGWMPKQAAISFVDILSAAQHIIFALFSIDMSLDFMSPAVKRFCSKNLALKNRPTLRESWFNTTDDNQLIAFSAKLEQRRHSKPSTELRYLVCGPRYSCFKKRSFRRRRAKLLPPTVPVPVHVYHYMYRYRYMY
jgi:hypothetical protein